MKELSGIKAVIRVKSARLCAHPSYKNDKGDVVTNEESVYIEASGEYAYKNEVSGVTLRYPITLQMNVPAEQFVPQNDKDKIFTVLGVGLKVRVEF